MLPFTKMHGLGNDFVLLDGRTQSLSLDIATLRHLADRHTGVGCDQILLIENAVKPDDFAYRVFNPDGSEVEQCGNGARCVARWLFDRDEIARDASLASGAGAIQVHMAQDGQVRVDMGKPVFAPSDIPLSSVEAGPVHNIDPGSGLRGFSVLSMGNPHAVLEVDDIASAPVEQIGQQLQDHPAFPRQVNVGFVQVTGPDRISLRVFERGAGETLACGSGACAAAVAMILAGRVSSPVQVSLPGGALEIAWSGPDARVMMTGAADYAFRGEIALPVDPI
ncbi:MAG: diaminopimelate epimerase [Lysobacterales bacterium]